MAFVGKLKVIVFVLEEENGIESEQSELPTE